MPIFREHDCQDATSSRILKPLQHAPIQLRKKGSLFGCVVSATCLYLCWTCPSRPPPTVHQQRRSATPARYNEHRQVRSPSLPLLIDKNAWFIDNPVGETPLAFNVLLLILVLALDLAALVQTLTVCVYSQCSPFGFRVRVSASVRAHPCHLATLLT